MYINTGGARVNVRGNQRRVETVDVVVEEQLSFTETLKHVFCCPVS